jgi:hypothetical protein
VGHRTARRELSRLYPLLRQEDQRAEELWWLVDALSPEQVEARGYQAEWSAKDLVAHLGCWYARAVVDLEQMRENTYRGRRRETPEERLARLERENRRYFETWAGERWDDVRVEWWSSRSRLLEELGLAEGDPRAEKRFERAAIRHYEDHLPRLREWVAELRDEEIPGGRGS